MPFPLAELQEMEADVGNLAPRVCFCHSILSTSGKPFTSLPFPYIDLVGLELWLYSHLLAKADKNFESCYELQCVSTGFDQLKEWISEDRNIQYDTYGLPNSSNPCSPIHLDYTRSQRLWGEWG